MPISPAPLRVLILVGSARPGSCSGSAAATMETLLAASSTEVLKWDPAEWPLPMADPAYHDDPLRHPDPEVSALARAAASADAFVLVSPVYHNSYSGLLKNCLDHLAIAQFAYKPVALIGHGHGLSAVQVCDHLRIVVRGLHGLALPRQLVTVHDDFTMASGESPVLSSPEARERMAELAADLLFYGRAGQVRLTAKITQSGRRSK